MEENRNFIKGGLPLGSGDFVDKEKAQEKKNKLLAALDNINKVHEKKMTANTPATNTPNLDSVGITLDMLDKENADAVTGAPKTEYILDSQIERDPAPSTPDFPITYTEENSEPMLMDDGQNNYDLNQTMDGDPGEPMITLDDSQVGKRGKKSNSSRKNTNTCSPEQVKAGRGVAWMAYILFLLPLIFNGKNSYVRHHANEGLELNIIDIIGVGLILAYKFVATTNPWLSLALTIGGILGVALIAITTIVKVFLIFFALAGKEASTPFFGKARIIK